MNPSRLAKTVVLFLIPWLVLGQNQNGLEEIKAGLACSCSCSMTVAACEGSMQCEAAANLSREAQVLLDQDMDVDLVLATFVDRYGDQVLSAPPTRGFSLMAWILPIFSFLVAGIAITMLLSSLRPGIPEGAATGMADPIPGEVNDTLDQRLNRLLEEAD